jgi:hypothetical protein
VSRFKAALPVANYLYLFNAENHFTRTELIELHQIYCYSFLEHSTKSLCLTVAYALLACYYVTKFGKRRNVFETDFRLRSDQHVACVYKLA